MDNGDLFSPAQKRPLLSAGLITDAMNQMGYDALNLGEQEFSHGGSLVKRMAASAGFALLSANAEAKTKSPIWVPYIIKEIRGIRVAVVGIVAPVFISTNPFVTAWNPEDCLAALIPELRKKADVCILLSHTGYDRTVDLVRRVPGIDIAIAGHGRKKQMPVKIDHTIVTAASYKGEFVGVLTLTWDMDDRKIDRFDGVMIHLGENFENDPGISAIIRKYAAMANKQLQGPKPETITVERLRKMTPEAFMEFFRKQQAKRQQKGLAQ